MKYKEMTDTQLSLEIVRVRELMRSGKPHTYHQNKKYLQKLESEWRYRKNGKS